MSKRIRIIAKYHEEVPIHLLSKLLIAQAREERRKRATGELRHKPRTRGDAA